MEEEKWRKMERLALLYINKTIFNRDVSVGEAGELTRKTRDNGYDAIWNLTINNRSNIQLMESKLRESQKSLTLNDCSKAMIVAFNFPADYLYISTNLNIAPQAKEHINKMQLHSSLKIRCVTGNDLGNFAKENRKQLSTMFDVDFLDYIEQLIQNNDADEKIDDFISEVDEIIFGQRHNDYVIQILQYFDTNRQALLIEGESGVGKSFVLNAVQQQFYQKEFRTKIINMNCISTPRGLFICLLECIWGISLDEFLVHQDQNELKEMLTLNKLNLDDKLVSAVMQALTDSSETFNKYADMYLQCLLNYLSSILKDKQLHLSVVFENISFQNEDNISFLLSAGEILSFHGVKVIFECRTPFTNSNKSAERLYERLQKFCTRFAIKPFENTVATQYIYTQLEGNLSEQNCEILADLLRYNPLETIAAIKLLQKKDKSFFCKLNECSLIEGKTLLLHENLFQANVIPCIVSFYRNEKIYNELFEISIIFNGQIPIYIISELYKDKLQYINDIIISCTVFEIRNGIIKCHLRYLQAIINTQNLFISLQVANKLYNLPNANFDDATYINILYASNKSFELSSKVLQHILNLKIERAFSQIVFQVKRYIDYINSNEKDLVLKLLLFKLDALSELHQLNNSEYADDWKQIKKLINENEKYSICNITYTLLLWNKHFVKGEFIIAKTIIKQYYDNLNRVQNNLEDDYIGQIVNAYGLTIKELENGDAAFSIFSENHKLYPESFFISVAYYCQKSNALLRTEPPKAIKFIKKMLNTVEEKNYPYQQILHTRVDLCMCKVIDMARTKNFNISKIKKIDDELKFCQNLSDQTNINMQKGRILNLRAILKIASNDFSQAKDFLVNAIDYLYDSDAQIYLWRAQFSLLSLYINNNYPIQETRALLDNIVSLLSKNFVKKIKSDIGSASYYVLLVCCLYYHNLKDDSAVKKILRRVSSQKFNSEYKQLSSDSNWKEKINTKVFCVNSIMVAVG